jgi:hypothetical protein
MHRLRIDIEHLTTPLKTSRMLTRRKNPRMRSLLGGALVMRLNTYGLATRILNRKQKHLAPQLKLGRLLPRRRLKIHRARRRSY